jgi:hypothetical protein
MFVYYESITQSEGLTEELGWKGIIMKKESLLFSAV